jgi:hypothetical protein
MANRVAVAVALQLGWGWFGQVDAEFAAWFAGAGDHVVGWVGWHYAVAPTVDTDPASDVA